MSIGADDDSKLPRHRHRLYWFVYIVILLFVTVAVLEIGARGFIALQGLHRFNERLTVIDQAIAHTKVARAHIPAFASNPYWGYGHAKGISSLQYFRSSGSAYHYPLSEQEFALLIGDVTANNWGFWADRDYPANEPNAYVVGVFGGSVANFFYAMMRKELERGLAAILGRKVVVLNFAVGGSKQPQQVQILTFFGSIGQKFDLVLNIDGLNEVSMSTRNAQADVATVMPFYSLLAQLRQDQQAALQIAEYTSQAKSTGMFLESMRAIIEWNIQHSRSRFIHVSAIAVSISQSRKLIALRAAVDHQRRPALESTWATTPAFGRLFDTDVPAEQGIRVWMESARIMVRVAAGIGADYIEFVQPSQYVTQRKFSDEERAIAHDGFGILMRPYPDAVRRVGELASEGIKIFSLIEVFDTTEGPIYVDGCCHVNLRGNHLIAEEIIRRLRAEIAKPGSQKLQ